MQITHWFFKIITLLYDGGVISTRYKLAIPWFRDITTEDVKQCGFQNRVPGDNLSSLNKTSCIEFSPL